MSRQEHGADPVAWALRTAVPLDEANLHLAELEAAGLLGMVEEHGRTTVYLPRRVEGLALGGQWEAVDDRDWNTAWREGLEPVTVGAVRIAPPWAAAGGDVIIEPAQAFGTGHHETTTGCLAALQEADLRGRRILDVGTGTGLLAIAALRLGAAAAVAVDTDPLAVAAARDNARRNAVALDVRLGSVDATAGESFDVVVANLDTDTVRATAAALAGALVRRGTLIVSGVSRERATEALAALEAAGLRCWPRAGREWVVIVAQPEPEG